MQWLARLDVTDALLRLGAGGPFSIQSQYQSFNPSDSPVLLLRNAAKISRGQLESRLLRSGCPGIYDLDDALPWDDGNLAGHGAFWKRPWPRSLIATRAASAADRVIAGNDTLAEWAAQHCRDVVVVPSCVEPTDYERKQSWQVFDVPRIGWIGTAATEPYLLDIAPALAEVHRRTGALLTILGATGDAHPSLAPFTEKVLWNLDRQHSLPAGWDVGIMPLRDGPYERAKCAYKLLQYGAVGLPSIGSPVGASASVLRAFGAASPTTNSEWVDALLQSIAASADERQRAGERAAAVVTEGYSFDAWEPTWRLAVPIGARKP